MFEDKVLKHKRAEGYYRRNAALGNVDGAWKNFVESNKVPDPSSMVPEPRNMYNQGQLVRNTVDGSRPGYQGNQGLNVGDPNPGAKVHFNKAMNELYEQFNKKVVDAASIQEYGVTFDKLKGKDIRKNFKKYFKQDMKDYGEYIGTNHPEGKDRRTLKKRIRDVKKADIKLKIIDEIKGGQFDAKNFSEANNLTLDQLKTEAKQLQRNIYNKRMITKGMETGAAKLPYIPDDINVTDNILKTLVNSELVVNESNKIDNIMFDAFGRVNLEGTNTPNSNYNLLKLDAINKNLKEYNILKKYLETNFNIITELDHPLDQKTIKQLMNGTAEELSRVNILEKNLNNSFKKTLNDRYLKAVDSNNLVQKRAVEKIAKKFNLNLGSVPDGTFFDVSKINRGVGSFETLNIKDEMLKSLKNAADLNNKWGQYIKENPNVFKDAGIDLKTLKKPKNVENIATNINAIIKELGGKEKMSKLLATGTGSIEERNLIRQVIKTGFDFAQGTGKAAVNLLNPKEFLKLKNWVGKPAMAFMAAVEGLDVADRWVRQGIPIKEALGEKWTKFLMPRTLKEYQTEGMREANALSSPASKRYAKNIDLSNDLIRTYDKLEMLEKGEAAKITGTSDVERIANLKKSITAKEKKYSEFINQKDKDGNVLGDGELDFKKDYNEYRALTKKGRDFKAFTTTGRDFTDLNIPFTEIGGMNDMGTDKMSGLKIDRTYTPMYKIGTSKIPSEHELALDATLSARPHVREKLIAPTTSKNFKYQDQKLPDEIRQMYENYATEEGIPEYGILPPRTSLSQVPNPDGGNMLDAITKFYNVGQKRKQASMYPDFHGSQFAEGGIANTRVGFKTGSSIASILSKFFKPKPKKTITIKRGESGTIGASGNSEKDFFNRYYFPPKGGFTNQSADARYFSKLGGPKGKPKVLTAEITPQELKEGYRLRSLDSKDPEIGDIIIPQSAKDKVKTDYYNTIRARIEKILKNND